MFLIDYPVKSDAVMLYNNNENSQESQLLYKKVGKNVKYSSNFYNINIMLILKKLFLKERVKKLKNAKK